MSKKTAKIFSFDDAQVEKMLGSPINFVFNDSLASHSYTDVSFEIDAEGSPSRIQGPDGAFIETFADITVAAGTLDANINFLRTFVEEAIEEGIFTPPQSLTL